jgi:GH35 family endo-1,4-beta-xylanase
MKIWLRKIAIIQLLIFLSVSWVNAQETIFDRLWTDPQVVDRINRDIEQYRKGDAAIEVIDKRGNHISNVLVDVHQQTHEFLFGCNLFVLGQLQTPELNTKYETAFAKLFNFATIPFYWGDLEPEEGKPRFMEGSSFIWRRPPPDQLLKWCKEHNITPKGHCLMYVKSIFMPSWTAKDDPEKLISQSAKHIDEIAQRYKNEIFYWDVTNEEIARLKYYPRWHKVPENYMSWCYQQAGSKFTKQTVLIHNETSEVFSDTDDYIAIFRLLKKEGLPVGGMGLQMHAYEREEMLNGELHPPKQQLDVFSRLGKMNLPIYMTEITVPGRGENGAELQAKIVKILYRFWFSIPNMAGITWWNLGDLTAIENENKAMGGLLDSEMNPKPAYETLDQLINHEWKTNLNISSNSQGNVRFRGFYGKYKITVRYNGKSIEREINLTKTGNNKFVIQL